MMEIVIKLSNDFEFSVDALSVNYSPHDKCKSLMFVKHFKDCKIREIEEQLTPENMEIITVLRGGVAVYELENYTEIVSADVNIDRENQVFTVRAAIPKSGGDTDE